MNFLKIISTAALLVSATPALSQSVVGTALVEGRTVELLSDKRWRFQDKTQSGCQQVKAGVSLCGLANSQWRTANIPNPQASIGLQWSDRVYAIYIIEELGLSNGLNSQFMRAAALEMMATFQGIKAEQVPVLGIDAVEIGDSSGERIKYTGVLNNTPFVYGNSIFIDNNRTTQIVVFGLGNVWTDEMQQANDALFEMTKFEDM